MNRENAYQRLAPLYEELCDDCDYENWSQYFVMLLCGALHTEENNIAGLRGLDIGCGSGILSIASLLLGAKSAFGVDIDSLAVKTAQANALENGFDESKFKAVQGNLSDKVSGKYNVVVANIVADIIMEFNKEVGKYLENDGVYITGGIIESREDEVLLSFAQNGFEVKERFEEKGWLVFVVKKSK